MDTFKIVTVSHKGFAYLILLAGKGHDNYQEAAGVRHDYDERALARQLSEQR